MLSSEIPPSDIYAILAGLARRQLGMDPLQSRELDAYLRHEADKSAQGLLQHTTIELKLNQYGLDLRQALQRGAVEAWQSLHQERPVYETVPERCPACAGLMLGKWRCELCGLELFRWQARAPKDALDSMGTLPWQHVLLPDPRRRRVIVIKLGTQPEVVWQVSFAADVCEAPCSARLLPGSELLVADRAGKVMICNLFGEVIWKVTLPLKEPVYVNASSDGQRIYLADRGTHQVMAIRRSDMEVIFQYGVPGTAGRDEGYLDRPACVQPTVDGTWLIADTGNRRVIEISELSRKLRRILGADAKLEQPTWCEQLPDDQTTLLDADTYRLIELDSEYHLADSCAYYQSHLDSRYRLNEPMGVMRRENGNFLLSNGERVIEVNPSQKRLLWFSLLTDLRPPATFVRREVTLEKQPLASTRLPTPFKLMDALRSVPVFEDAPPAFFEKIKLCLRYEEHPAGKLLIREGQRGDAMYLIREGSVEIIKDFQTIAMLGAGDIFGEMALLNSEPRTANVRIAAPTRLYKLNRLAFESVIQAFPDVHERIKRLADARQQVMQPAQVESAKERLSKLMESHKQRLTEMRERRQNSPTHHQLVEGPLHWKLRYGPLEQHLIQEARIQNYRCLELHVRLHPSCRMKSVRVSLLVMNLEKHGEIIKTHPLPEEILQEKVDSEVILTILTRSSRVRLLEDAGGVAEIDDIKAIPVQF